MKPIVEINFEKDVKQNTVVLMWNPSISSYTMERFEDDLKALFNGWVDDYFNWSVWEFEKAKEGDKFYMVKVGPGTNGIVMAGKFTSDPYKDEDWSGKKRTVYYMDMEISHMIHPDRCPLLTSEKLSKEIPDFVWTGGHSGQVLNDEQAKKLDSLWDAYLNGNLDIFEVRAAKLE